MAVSNTKSSLAKSSSSAPRKLTPWAVVGRFIVVTGSTLTLVFTLLQGVDWVFNWKPLAATGFLGATSIVLGCIVISALYVLGYTYQTLQENATVRLIGQDQPGDGELTDTLMGELRAAYQEERWGEVIKIGSVLSRPLWVTGKLRLRVELGKLVESAAAFSKEYDHQAGALIDDLGWTVFKLGNPDEAKQNILHGIDIARREGIFHLASKGHRHLSGIALEKGNMDDAVAHYAIAQEYAEQIPDPAQKQELLAGLRVNQAQLAMQRRKWEDALRDLEDAQKMYQTMGDQDREVKLYHYKGEVLYEIGKLREAKDVHREGLAMAKQLSRKDEILENTAGIARVAAREGDNIEARRSYLEAARIARELGCTSDAKEYEASAATLATKLSNR